MKIIPHHLERLVQLPGWHLNQLFLRESDRTKFAVDAAIAADAIAATIPATVPASCVNTWTRELIILKK
jgi:hypothetical protein